MIDVGILITGGIGLASTVVSVGHHGSLLERNTMLKWTLMR